MILSESILVLSCSPTQSLFNYSTVYYLSIYFFRLPFLPVVLMIEVLFFMMQDNQYHYERFSDKMMIINQHFDFLRFFII